MARTPPATTPSRWRGFERPPSGYLIQQRIDLNAAMGIAYERSLRFYKRPHVHDRAILIFPRGPCVMDVTTTADQKVYRVTSSDVLVVPTGIEHDDRAVSFVYDTFALLPSDRLWHLALGPTLSKERSVPRVASAFRRSPWLEMLLGEYFAARVLERAHSPQRNAHLEALIVHEVATCIRTASHASAPPDRRSEPATLVSRALRFLEANLFAPLDLEKLASATGASRSSLLRHFRVEMGLTPMSYVRGRRLDEARSLVRRRNHNVSEIARLVGYTNLAAFSEAYRARFGEPPSSGK